MSDDKEIELVKKIYRDHLSKLNLHEFFKKGAEEVWFEDSFRGEKSNESTKRFISLLFAISEIHKEAMIRCIVELKQLGFFRS